MCIYNTLRYQMCSIRIERHTVPTFSLQPTIPGQSSMSTTHQETLPRICWPESPNMLWWSANISNTNAKTWQDGVSQYIQGSRIHRSLLMAMLLEQVHRRCHCIHCEEFLPHGGSNSGHCGTVSVKILKSWTSFKTHQLMMRFQISSPSGRLPWTHHTAPKLLGSHSPFVLYLPSLLRLKGYSVVGSCLSPIAEISWVMMRFAQLTVWCLGT